MSVNVHVIYLTAFDGRNDHPQIFARMALMCVYNEDKMKVKMTMMMMMMIMIMIIVMVIMVMTMVIMMMITMMMLTMMMTKKERKKGEQLTVEEPFAMLMLASILSW